MKTNRCKRPHGDWRNIDTMEGIVESGEEIAFFDQVVFVKFFCNDIYILPIL